MSPTGSVATATGLSGGSGASATKRGAKKAKAAGVKRRKGVEATSPPPPQSFKAGCCGNLSRIFKNIILLVISALGVAAIAFFAYRYVKTNAGCANDLWPSSVALGLSLALVLLAVIVDTVFQLTGEETSESSMFRKVWSSFNLTLLSFGMVTASLAWNGYELSAQGLLSSMLSQAASGAAGAGPRCDPGLWNASFGVSLGLLALYVLYLVPFFILACIACCCTRACITRGTTGDAAWASALNFFGVKRDWYDPSKLHDPAESSSKAGSAASAAAASKDRKKNDDAGVVVASTRGVLSEGESADDNDADEEQGNGPSDEANASAQKKPLVAGSGAKASSS